MSWFVTSKLGRTLALIGAVILAILTFGASQRRQGRKDAKLDAAEDKDRRLQDGLEAVEDLRGADRDELSERLSRNGDKWRRGMRRLRQKSSENAGGN